MTDLQKRARAGLAAGAVAALVGCSSSSDGTGGANGIVPGGSSGSNDNGDGSSATDARSGDDASDDATSASPGDGGGSMANGADGATPLDAADGSRPDDGAVSPSPDAGPHGDGGSGNPTTDESAWLDPQNAARAAVNANEPPLTWDPIAAQVALNYAMQCNYAHNPNRGTDYSMLGGSGSVGENIAAGSPTLTIAQATGSWVNEQTAYNYANNTCNTAVSPECGHYTQIVWKTTTRVGCAIVNCTMNSPFSNGRPWVFAVCDYTPAGNLVPPGNSTPERPY